MAYGGIDKYPNKQKYDTIFGCQKTVPPRTKIRITRKRKREKKAQQK